jgi:class 3 adenylate cyclase
MTDAAGAVMMPSPSGQRHDTGTRTVLFTDIVGSTELTQRVGDEAAFAVVERHDELVRAAVAQTDGRLVKHTGDGIMAVFASVVAAVRCANEIQRVLSAGETFAVRIGLAAGEPVERDGDFFGGAVQLAARLCSHAAPREILVSSAVADLCIGKGFAFDDLGSVSLKGFATPVPIRRATYAVA